MVVFELLNILEAVSNGGPPIRGPSVVLYSRALNREALNIFVENSLGNRLSYRPVVYSGIWNRARFPYYQGDQGTTTDGK